jgi:hypothetical protein
MIEVQKSHRRNGRFGVRTGPHTPFYEESDATRAARLFRLAYGRRLRCLLKAHSGELGPTLLSMTLSR